MKSASRKQIQRGVFNKRPLPPLFSLLGKYIEEDATNGTVIGIFVGSNNYVLDNDPSGSLAIVGNQLRVDDTLTEGYYTITVSSDAGTLDFSIKVLGV
jgi:hypothetical protein